MALNERVWAGHVISWIKEAILNGQTIFEEATNDEGIKTDEAITRFPDVLLFLDKVTGLIFNGWELKFPDTAVDDKEMLLNALEKAKHLKSNSLVTWNGKAAIIWLIKDENYNLASLEILKSYLPEKGINSRSDLSNRQNYLIHEPELRARLLEILHDLEQLYKQRIIREALNISSNIVEAITKVAEYLIPLFRESLNAKIRTNKAFRKAFGAWKILESSTLKILASSSRRREIVDPVQVLAKFTYYKFIGKILFYLTLSENLSGKIPSLYLDDKKSIKLQLDSFFQKAKQIDYQAVFEKDFTDAMDFTPEIEKIIFQLLGIFNEIDFRYLPNEVIGNILENLVPKTEKQKFGQYFTAETLALLVSMSSLQGRDDVVVDPTSGTGTFLTVFYNLFKYFGSTNHQQLLNQIWGNDISHFPAVLSVINLYKQNLKDNYNFPRITRKDYFKIIPGEELKYPHPKKENKFISVNLPKFDAIISNFPFIQQEDIPNKALTVMFRQEFQQAQRSFIKNKKFNIDERSDYFVYCFYNSLKFLKEGGFIAAITSNAWLGKNYGIQFKRFLLDNFSIRYIFRSNAEHWFHDSKVSTIFATVQKTVDHESTRFITLNKKLKELFPEDKKEKHVEIVEELYNEIDNCDHPENVNWLRDQEFPNVYHKKDGSVSVSIIERSYLESQIKSQENWSTNFLAQEPLQKFREKLINPFPEFMDVGRGTRTGWDDMHILKMSDVKVFGIEGNFLIPILKSSQNLSKIHYTAQNDIFFFVCDKPLEMLKNKFPKAHSWILKWSNERNKVGVLLPTVLKDRRPYWYTLRPEEPANVFISINPNEKLFFAYCDEMIYLNQRLVAIRVTKENLELIVALLNSIVSLLIVEFNGVNRNLGALDLNADFFKTKMKIFNPALLSEKAKMKIIDSFKILSLRKIENFDSEYQKQDRISFDKTVLEEFGYDPTILPLLYEILIQLIRDRIEMKTR
jgi:hypothetical protein